jgi:hypothetical protein
MTSGDGGSSREFDGRAWSRLLAEIPERALASLAASLRGGALRYGLSDHGIGMAIGPAAARVAPSLNQLVEAGWSPEQLAIAIEAHLGGRSSEASHALEATTELVLSGPEVAGIPTRDTAAVFRTLLREATREILVTGYAVHGGRELFAEAAARLDADPGLAMTLVLDFRRDADTTATSVLARRRSEDFWKRDWPKASRRPRLLYDPRGLEPDQKARAAMHAKVVVVDRKVAFVSSANLTERAQERNIEVGVLIREESLARQLAEYFEGLEREGVLRSAGGEVDH